MSTEANTTQTTASKDGGSKITPSAPANPPTSDPKDPMSILDFVKEQMQSKQAEAEGQKKEAPKTKVATKPVAKKQDVKQEVNTEVKTEAKVNEAKTESTGDEELKLSKFSQSLLNEETKDGEEKKTEDTKVEANKETSDEEGDDDIKLPETASVAAKDAFKRVNSERSKLKKELATLKEEKSQLEEKLKTANTEETSTRIAELEVELERVKKFNEEAETKLYALDVQQSARYKETISEPLQAIAGEVEVLAKKYQIDAVKLRKAMAAEDTNGLSELLSEGDVNEFDKVQLAKLRTDVKGILKTREALEKDSKRAAEVLRRAEEEQTKQYIQVKKQEYTKSLVDHKDKITGFIPQLFQKTEDDQELNTLVDNYDKFLKTADPTAFTAEQTAQAMAMAGATPILFATIERLMADNKVLIEKYKKLTKSNPAAGPSTATTVNTPPKTDGSISDFVRDQMSKRGR
jgi:hypothetical protein